MSPCVTIVYQPYTCEQDGRTEPRHGSVSVSDKSYVPSLTSCSRVRGPSRTGVQPSREPVSYPRTVLT